MLGLTYTPNLVVSSRIANFIKHHPPKYNILQIISDTFASPIIYNVVLTLRETLNTPPSGYFELEGHMNDIINYKNISVEITAITSDTSIHPTPFIQPILTANKELGELTLLIINDYKNLNLTIQITATKVSNVNIVGRTSYIGFTS